MGLFNLYTKIQFMNTSTKPIYVGKTYLSRNNLSSHEYAQSSHLYEILTQATKILLRKTGIASNQIFNQYLSQNNRGQHVLLKSYGSFSKSPLCKLCFLHNFLKIFEIQTIQRNGLDYYQLSRLLCSDFPRQFIQKAVAILLPDEDSINQMYKPVDSKKFTQAIYLFVIYTEYFQSLRSYFLQEQEMDFLQFLKIISEYDIKNITQFSKPPFSVMAQTILNVMRKKRLFDTKSAEIIFISEQNIQDFVRDAITNEPNQKINLSQFLSELIQSHEYQQLVQQNLSMFQNSQTWSTQNHKILFTKENAQAPLNVKKKATKK